MTKGLVILIILSACLFAGYQREADRAHWDMSSRPTLYYGDRAPPFCLRKTSGGTQSLADLGGKWSLLVFAMRGCQACDRELSHLSDIYKSVKNKVNIVAVMVEQPLFPFVQKIVGAYAEAKNLPFPVIIDEGFQLQRRYCDGPMVRMPFSVLIDASARVRFVQPGCELQGDGRSVLAATIQNLAEGHSLLVPALRTRDRSLRAPDGEVFLTGGARMRLSDLWRRHVVVLIFCSDSGESDRECDQLHEILSRYERSGQWVRFLFVYRTHPSKPQSAHQPAFLTGTDRDGALFKDYNVVGQPQVVVIRDGEVIAGAKSNVCCSNLLFPTIAQAVLECDLERSRSATHLIE